MERATVIDIHAKALDYLDEVKGMDVEATGEHIAATVATILYLLLENEEGDK